MTTSYDDLDKLLDNMEEPDVWCAPQHAILSNQRQYIQNNDLRSIINNTLSQEKERKNRLKLERQRRLQQEREMRAEREAQLELERQRREEERTEILIARGYLHINDDFKIQENKPTSLKSIPIDELIKLAEKAKQNKDDACPICFINTNDKVITHCGHIFCKDCVNKLKNNKCPYCRS
jgi:hypothetical protein